MKRGLIALFLVFCSALSASSKEELYPTSISFEGNKRFISSLTQILKQDFSSSDVKKALEPFNAKSVGFRAASKKELFENLPLASNDLIISSRNLGLLDNPKYLVELQEEVYVSAVAVIDPEILSKNLNGNCT